MSPKFLSRPLRVFLMSLMCATAVMAADDDVLTGEIISSGRATTNRTEATNVFDGDENSIYSASSADMAWVGLDLGTPHIITSIGIMPKNTSLGSQHTQLGVVEGANEPDFMDGVPLLLLREGAPKNELTWYESRTTRGFRYVRYVGPAGSHCELAELRFCGHEGEGTDSLFYQVTGIPTVSIHVKDNKVPTNKGQDFASRMTITYEGGTLIQEYPILTRVRGNFSASHENRPYRIKFDDGKSHHMLHGSAADESPAKAKKFTLINNYGDKTLIRNNVAFEISRRAGMTYTPWCRNVDVILNGDYRGCYQLTDWLGIDKKRIDITEMEPEDVEGEELTGGYFFEMNGYAGSDPVHFTSRHGNPITVHSPDDDKIQTVQFNYLRDHFNRMEELVYGSNWTSRTQGYRTLLDLDSFLRYFLSAEYAGNTDMIWQVFMYKERGDDHIYTGPIWDNDLALDNDGGVYPGNKRSDWTYTIRCAGNWMNFVSRILSDGGAMAQLQEMWAELRDNGSFDDECMAHYVDSLREVVRASATLNFVRWPYLKQQVHCNPAVWGSWDAEVDVVRDYVAGRVAWFDKKLGYNTLSMREGSYLINSPYDLITFARLVNGGLNASSAILTTDIDLTGYERRFESIGTNDFPYTGTFDGNHHSISNLSLVTTSNNVGLFGICGDGATINNLHIDSTCVITGNRFVGSIVGYIPKGTVTLNGCSNEGAVTAIGSYAGGLVGGGSFGSVVLWACCNVGPVTAAARASALVGHLSSVTVSDSYNVGVITGISSDDEAFAAARTQNFTNCFDTRSAQVNTVTDDQVASGELCYLLNLGSTIKPWRQNIDNGRTPDPRPVNVTNHGFVYLVDDAFTNRNPEAQGWQYYKLEVTAVNGGDLIQFSEFDILDALMEECPDLQIYDGTDSNISYEDWPNLCDNNTGTKYCSRFYDRAWFLFDAGEAFELGGYRIYTANDTQSNSGRNPVSWTLSASDVRLTDPDDAGWLLLDERKNDHTLEATNYTPYDFPVSLFLETLSFDATDLWLNPGDSGRLSLTFKPAAMANFVTLSWQSSNPEVASVNEQGVVTAHGVGTTIITATATNQGNMAVTCAVHVTTDVLGFRYYLWEVIAVTGGSTVQISEFDILDANGEEYDNLVIRKGICEHFGNEDWPNLTDNDVSTKWCGPFNSTAWQFFDAGESVKPYGYRLYTANDTQNYSDRNPKSWRLWGSNILTDDLPDPDADGKEGSWQLIDERINCNTLGATNYTPYDFSVTLKSGIDSPLADEESNSSAALYDLQGRKVTNSHAPGLYIKQGKKVLVR